MKYIFTLLFTDMIGIDVQLSDDLQHFTSSAAPKLAYANERIGDALFIQARPLLFESGLKKIEPDVFTYKNHKAIFASNGDLPFDLFAASFYLLTRYEEYFATEKDQYGRFKASASLAYRHQFLQIPVVNYWVEELKALLSSRYPGLTFKEPKFTATLSFDIDVAFAFKGRSLATRLLGSVKDVLTGRVSQLQKRWKVIGGKEMDPYDSYDYIRSSLADGENQSLFFFLLSGKKTAYDRNLSPDEPVMRHLVKSISDTAAIGIHPSYYSGADPLLTKKEKERLEHICGNKINKSRQHYLRWQLPGTFLQLAAEGIRDEYSMGYAELPGFRAGICTPFLFYNILAEEITALTIHPISYMEGSFIEDMQLTQDEAIEHIKIILAEVRKMNGDFLCIWHNHTLSDYGIYQGWRKPYEETLRLLKEKQV